jgi:lysine 2,3-aminomutase
MNDLSRRSLGAAAPAEGRTLRRPGELAAAGLVDPAKLPALEAVAARYAVAITPALAELIAGGDPGDPVARQLVPDAAELDPSPGESADPIGDRAHEAVPGVVHRYPDRVLLKLVSSCAVYCRFCFRREAVGQGAPPLAGAALATALAYIRGDAGIWEVIVSGGDPLVASPRRLAALGKGLAGIAHVKVVRFHTRVPVAAPERITPAMVAALTSAGKATWLAVHANHPRELSGPARRAVARLADAGIALVSQSVLLAGVNDDAATLGALMRAFVECRIKPYYLHHGDLAPGTGHFRVPLARGQELLRVLRGRYSGLCQPSYVLDIPGGHGKSPVGPGYLGREDGTLTVEDYRGIRHRCPEAE